MSRKDLAALAMGAAVFFLVPRADAQSTGALTGLVGDSSGAVVAGASVTCVHTETGMVQRATTGSSGLFRFPNLPVGSYEITASHPGFTDARRSGIELLTEHTVSLSLVLQVGGISQSVVVDAPAPLVQAVASEVQSTVDSRQMRDLPLNGRNAFQLAELTPGAVSTDATTSPGDQDNVALSVNGLRPPETIGSWTAALTPTRTTAPLPLSPTPTRSRSSPR